MSAEPSELQLMRLAKKARAGAKFLVTQPVFDLESFGAWWQEIAKRGLHEQVAIVAGIEPLGEHTLEHVRAKRRRWRRTRARP